MTLAPRSLLARILWWHGAAVVVTALAMSIGVYLFLDATADHLERQTLRSQIVALRSVITVDAAGKLVIPAADGGHRSAAAGMSFAILDAGGRPLASPSSSTPVAAARIPRLPQEAYFTRRSRHSFYAGLSTPTTIGGRRVWIVAIQNLDHPANVVDDIVGQFLLHGLTIILPLLLLLLGVDALIVRRALRPVRRASALVRTIDPSRLDIRVTDPAIPTEVRPLAEAVNAALDRLTHSLRMQRDFTADAAHELRTPITVARVRAAQIADPALRAALTADLDSLGQTVSHLLDIAELDSLDQLTMEPVDLSALARQSVAAIAPLAFRRGQSIEVTGAARPVIVRGQSPFIARALAALVENAVKHTPAGTCITVGVDADGRLSVMDDGPGIAPADQESVFRRFWRRDRRSHSNAGLGLAIVQRVALAHDAPVTLESRPGHTVFAIRFALAAIPSRSPDDRRTT